MVRRDDPGGIMQNTHNRSKHARYPTAKAEGEQNIIRSDVVRFFHLIEYSCMSQTNGFGQTGRTGRTGDHGNIIFAIDNGRTEIELLIIDSF